MLLFNWLFTAVKRKRVASKFKRISSKNVQEFCTEGYKTSSGRPNYEPIDLADKNHEILYAFAAYKA